MNQPSQNNDKHLQHLKSLADLLDTKFEGPMGIRFGLDALLGLIPVVGDVTTTVMSLYIMAQASSRGCSSATLLRMSLNIFLENLVDSIPVFGNLFDFYFKANVRNLRLLEQHLQNPKAVTVKSTATLAAVLLILLSSIGLTVFITVMVLIKFFEWLGQ